MPIANTVDVRGQRLNEQEWRALAQIALVHVDITPVLPVAPLLWRWVRSP